MDGWIFLAYLLPISLAIFPFCLLTQNQYERCKDLVAAQGVKIIAKDLEKTLAGLPLRVAYHDDEIAVLRVWMFETPSLLELL